MVYPLQFSVEVFKTLIMYTNSTGGGRIRTKIQKFLGVIKLFLNTNKVLALLNYAQLLHWADRAGVQVKEKYKFNISLLFSSMFFYVMWSSYNLYPT